jgi:sec-independent protein translocase protein TatC
MPFPFSQTDAPEQASDPALTPGYGDGAQGPAPTPAEEGTMSFLDHLEELRWALIKGLAGLMAGVIACGFFSRWIVDTVLIGPTRPDFFMYRAFGIDAKPLELLNRTITGQFFADLGTIVVVGCIAGSPLFVYFLWRFIEPALYPHERSGMRFAAVAATFFFACGIAFGYLILTPLALQFFAGYTISEQIANQFDIMTYFSMVSFWAVGAGLLFELPVAVYFLSKVGLLTPQVMRTYRKYALIVVLVLAAFLTPPDPVSQVIVAMPLMLLYQLSIYISAYVNKRRRAKLGMVTEE